MNIIIVNWCYISRGMGVIKVSSNKSDIQCPSRSLVSMSFDRPPAISY